MKWRGLTVDWNETAEDEDPAILWALKNEKFGIFDILPWEMGDSGRNEHQHHEVQLPQASGP